MKLMKLLCISLLSFIFLAGCLTPGRKTDATGDYSEKLKDTEFNKTQLVVKTAFIR